MARGTQHRKRRPAANARAAQSVVAKPKSKSKVKHPSWEDQLFFNRLRRHAKWMYILLAIFFAAGFVFLGVGSGAGGIGDVVQNFFNRTSGASGASLGSLQNKVREQPTNATAWHDLATKLQQDQKIDQAIDALKRYTVLRPNDSGGLDELAALYTRRADDYRNEAANAQAEAQLSAPGSEFRPPSSSAVGKLYADPSALQDPISNAVTTRANTIASDAYSKLTAVSSESVTIYKRLAKLNPSDATRQIQLGQAAESAGDATTATAAYKRFLKLAPDDPLAAQVRQQLAQLRASATTGAVPAG